MAIDIEIKIEKWKNKLLDLGKRNRLLNYKETKRSSLHVSAPDAKPVLAAAVLRLPACLFIFYDLLLGFIQIERISPSPTITSTIFQTCLPNATFKNG